MIPTALVAQLEQGLADFLRTSFWSGSPGFEEAVERLLGEPKAVMQGPWLDLRLPFASGGSGEVFAGVPLGYAAHRHQERAWSRLGGDRPRSTLVATGTGSGKTECFLIPILAHCLARSRQPGVKAILVYPMNALAADQAQRIARRIEETPTLKGRVTVGMYVGQEPGEEVHAVMGARHVITDRGRLRSSPPDILLTNYKMLDYLLVRPADRPLWRHNGPETLRYLVVDELHTFDGAQGTDLACLIRRLKARLGTPAETLCCVGTSATLGGSGEGGEGAQALVDYARAVFGEPFELDSVVTEERQRREVFLQGVEFEPSWEVPGADALKGLDPDGYEAPEAWLSAQHALWFGGAPLGWGEEGWEVALAERLRRHEFFDRLLRALGGRPRRLDAVGQELGLVAEGAAAAGEDAGRYGRRVLASFVGLLAQARVVGVDQLRPLVQVQVQLWVRELRRVVASVAPVARLAFFDDLTAPQRRCHLPVVHCNECGLMGWATLISPDRRHQASTELRTFYTAFFNDDPHVTFLFPLDPAWRVDGTGLQVEGLAARRAWRLRPEAMELVPWEEALDDEDAASAVAVVEADNTQTVQGRAQLHRRCPACEARDSISLVGFRAATLTSVFINQLFASPYNDDKKLLVFSDSVQDAAHRAGFYEARTWRFNLRVALQKVAVLSEGDPLSLLTERFSTYWLTPGWPDTMTPLEFVAAFIAPDMMWVREWEEARERGSIPPDAPLLRDVQRRVMWEVAQEYGFNSRKGRTLTRTGCSMLWPDEERLAPAVARLLQVLPQEVPGLETLREDELWVFLHGVLSHLKERGGIALEELRGEYMGSGGAKTFLLNRRSWLPNVGPRSRMPAFLCGQAATERFDHFGGRYPARRTSWYDAWCVRALGQDGARLLSLAVAAEVYPHVLRALVEAEVLERHEGQPPAWGLRPEALLVTSRLRELRCDHCRHALPVPTESRTAWEGTRCQSSGRCPGRYRVGTALEHYYGWLYRRGDVRRIFAAEHTGLLDAKRRAEVEAGFKAATPRPGDPNLLSCTPTLEMGIDIGDLSTAILGSVPPAQANYLQRVGRAGRRDGNAAVLTVASSRPHDLYFYADPEAMLSGEVSTPGVFLNASAVLERQLTAFCLDRWVASGVAEEAFPAQLRRILSELRRGGTTHFPHNLLDFIAARREALVDAFIALFGPQLAPDTAAHLRAFMAREDDQGPGGRVLRGLDAEARTREGLERRRDAARRQLDRLRAQPQDEPTRLQLQELEGERDALRALLTQLDGTSTLGFLTDEGLLPNYAFPEAAVRLRSVIFRRRAEKPDGDSGGRRYESWAYDWGRPASSALTELAPESAFYAGGRRVVINRVDLSASSVEAWRFCDRCSYAEMIAGADVLTECPSCGSARWSDTGQRRELVRLRQVYARESDRRSRIDDSQEERQPRYYNRQMLVSFRQEDQLGAWRLSDDAVPFAFACLRRASFREVNFGPLSDQGARVTIAGREQLRRGFTLCRHCGTVQSARRKDEPEHDWSCKARGKAAEESLFEGLYLYREFHSEALWMLLPIADGESTERQIHSFMAAFQVGLRAFFRGRVDHLHATVQSEPDAASDSRRQYLILYDVVPGGTGYLKELALAPDRIFDILEAARRRLVACACNADPDRDGCYACLYAWRNSYDMAETSRDSAVAILQRILQRRATLTAVDSLGHVSITALRDSELERRFIEALRRAGTAERPVELRPTLETGRPGSWRARIGAHAWLIEPQVELRPRPGALPLHVSVDFVLRPAWPGAQRRPLAIFTDGFTWHRNRVHHDLHQRMAVATFAHMDPFSLSWADVDSRLTPAAHFALHLHGAGALTDELLRRSDQLHLRGRLHHESFDLLLDTLADGDDGPPRAEALAWASAMALAAGPRPALSPQAALAPLRGHAPDALLDALEVEQAHETGPLLAATPATTTQGSPLTMLALVRGDRMRRNERAALTLIVVLDDSAEAQEHAAFRATWNGVLRLFNLLHPLTRVFFVGTAAHDRDDLTALLEARLELATAPDNADALPEAWAEVGAELTEFLDMNATPLLQALSSAGAPIPRVGIDLTDARGITVGAMGELAWPERRVAVVLEQPAPRIITALAGWCLLRLDDVLIDPAPLLGALTTPEEAP